MDNNLLEKVIVSDEIGNPGGSGLLSPEQSNKFIDYMWDTTVLGGQVRTQRMRSNEIELDRIGVGQRLLRGATEAVDTGENQGVFFSKISLTTKKLRLDWELSTETLEDNIEGEALEDHIARLMATQAGNDLEDLAINGEGSGSDPLLKVFTGWRKGALTGTMTTATIDGAAHVVDHAGGPLNRAAANKALKAMPRKFMQRRNELKFFTGTNLIQDYLYQLTEDGLHPRYGDTNQRVRTEGPAGFASDSFFGVPVQEVPLFNETRTLNDAGAGSADHGDLWLTFPKNLIWGVKREIKVYREFKNKKDTVEYTMYTRVGVAIEETDAFVIVKNIKVGS